jgi:pimeloyl-ACP methyl ester carboxylesterase
MSFGGCADRLILHPSTDPIAVAGGTRIAIPAPNRAGSTVEVWTVRTVACRGREPRAYVLQFIGNADRAEYAALRAADQWDTHPVEVWAVNYPAFGGSTGPVSMKGSAAASLAAYDALRARAAGRPIFLSGVSLGTAAALHVASVRPVGGLVLHNPPPLRQLILGRFGWWNLWLLAAPVACQVPSEFDSLTNARRVIAPAVFVLAAADEIVPPTYQRQVVDAYAGEKRLVNLAGANHNDMPEGQGEQDLKAGIDGLWGRAVGGALSPTGTAPAAVGSSGHGGQ